MSIVYLISEYKPRSAPDDSFDEIGVVAWPHIVLDFVVVLEAGLNDVLVGECNFPHEIAIVV